MIKDYLQEIAKQLNKKGYTGGIYYYKKNECSCCYGLKDVFFEINGNLPPNWCDNELSHKISFETKEIKVLTPLQEEYQHFVYEWNKTHSISKAPSFTSWKKFYKSN